ncbi:MAG: HYR domain-containing protein [bacterium]|nr:HYR domain-containing protein [bacterium]
MSKKYKIGLSILSVMLITFVWSSLVLADGFTIDNQSCTGTANEEVTFTISVSNAPRAVASFGFEISFDGSVLDYVRFEPGDLLSSSKFSMCQFNKVNNNTVKVGGLDPFGTGGIAKGESGTVGRITFKVLECKSSQVTVAKLTDDMAGWPVQAGNLKAPVVQHAPVLQPIGNQKVMVGNTLSFTVQATDEDGDAITYAASNLPAGATLDENSGQFTWTPTQVGTYSVEITATDSTGRSSSEAIDIEVHLASLSINNQSCTGAANEEVTFTISVNSAPNQVDAFGFEVSYDESVLEFKSIGPEGGTRGSLTQDFNLFGVNRIKTNTLKVAGLKAMGVGFAQGSSGSIVNLVFVVKSCELTTVSIVPTSLDGDVAGWSLAAGQLIEAPTISCPGNIVVEADSLGGALSNNPQIEAFLNGASAKDAQNNPLPVTNNAPAVFALGNTTVTFSTVNSAGAVNSCQAVVTVVDTIGPTITCPENITVEAEGPSGVSASNAKIQAFLSGATASDTVDGSVPVINNAPAQFALGSTEVTFTAQDAAGNINTCSALVSVVLVDKTPPTITCPQSITVEAEGPSGVSASNAQIQAFLSSATASDMVDGSVPVTNNAPAQFALGSTEVTFTAKDAAGNSTSCKATVVVVDKTAPVITCPGDVLRLEAEGPSGVSAQRGAVQAFLQDAVAVDTVDSSVTITNDAPAQFGLGYTLVTFTAEDDSGNKSTCTATVLVEDTTPPAISCPGDITVEINTPGSVPASNAKIRAFLNNVAASDSVSSVSITNNAPAQFALGSTEVTFTAKDAAGNTNTCSARVNVVLVDITPPAITCPQSITVAAEGPQGVSANSAQIRAFLMEASADDNIDGKVAVTNDAPSVFPLGDTTVTFEAHDSALNIATCTAVVRVEDKTPPEITCPKDITIETENASGVAASDKKIQGFLKEASAVDAIDGSLTVTNDAPQKFPVGETTVTFMATDKAGNTASCTAKVTVKKVAPAVSTTTGFYGGLYGGIFGGLYGTSYTGWSGLSTPYYQPSIDLYQTFDNQLYTFQQPWIIQSIWNPLYNNPTWPLSVTNFWNQSLLNYPWSNPSWYSSWSW